ncbi:MAG: glycosyltransferase family 9 protein [Ignavibacteria bacterium]
MKLPLIHFDCRHFEGDKPCFPNKQFNVFCDNCQYYEKDFNITGEFPEIKNISSASETDSELKTIVIIKLDAVGDVLRTTSILPSLKKKYPNSFITWVTRLKSRPVLNENDLIGQFFFVEESADKLYQKEFSIAINLDNGRDSCRIMNKIKSKEKYGYYMVNDKPYPLNESANQWYLMGVNDSFKRANKKTYHKIIHEICNLKYEYTKPVLKITNARRKIIDVMRNKLLPINFKEFILVNLGGGNRWQNKKWTKEGYSGLVNELSDSNPNKCIGVIAGVDDREFYRDVLKLINKKENIALFGCDNSMDEFIVVIYLADKIVTSDSLGLHIATALNKRTVVLVGPTSYTELDVFGNGKIIHSQEMECLCFYLNKCNQTINCMNTIPVKNVIDALN